MTSAADERTLRAIGALAGSMAGLLEATLVMGRTTGLGESILVLLNGALGYAACSLVIVAVWRVFPSRRQEGAWAVVACIPAGILAALLPITRWQMTGAAPEIALRVLSAATLGLLVTVMLASVVRRFPVLSLTSTWLAAHAVVLVTVMLPIIHRQDDVVRLWAGLLAGVGLTAAAWALERRRGGRDARRPLIAANVVAAGMLLLLPVLGRSRASGGLRVARPNVLLITVDTLRSDHVGAYGYARARTPHMDGMAARGVQFLETVAPAPLTCPSHASMLTGLYPVQHGALHNGTRLPSQRESLASILGRHGYRTGATVSGYTLDDDACGLGSHFQTYDDDFSAWWWLPDRATKLRLWEVLSGAGRRLGLDLRREDRPAARTTDRALSWLERSRHGPFFYWVHYFDPHVPYEPPPPFDALHDPGYAGPSFAAWYRTPIAQKEKAALDARAVRHMVALYDGEISYVDAELGRLLAALTAWGADQNTLVILTSDHGESLGEHGLYFEHSNYLYEEELRVPLLVTFPRGEAAGRRVAGQTRLIDLAPTVLDYLGLAGERPMEGRSLRPLIEGNAASPPPALAAVHPGAWESGRSIVALRHRGYKLIWTSPEWRFLGMRVPPGEELYDLGADPMELRNLSGAAPAVLAELRSVLHAWRAREVGAVSSMDDEVRRRLRSLGYVQ